MRKQLLQLLRKLFALVKRLMKPDSVSPLDVVKKTYITDSVGSFYA